MPHSHFVVTPTSVSHMTFMLRLNQYLINIESHALRDVVLYCSMKKCSDVQYIDTHYDVHSMPLVVTSTQLAQ